MRAFSHGAADLTVSLEAGKLAKVSEIETTLLKAESFVSKVER
ncbi:MAG: hypothetical protein ACM33V_01215 [Chloroflexota bacterium]